MHRTIKGRKGDGSRYSAMEPDAFAWVHATLAVGIFEGTRHFSRPMSDREKQEFWTQWRDVGRLIGVRYSDLPEGVTGLDAYFDGVVEEKLAWTPAIPEVLTTLSASKPPPGVPAFVWRVASIPAAKQQLLATVGMMPPRLRERLGLPWTRADELAFRALGAASRLSSPLIRGPLANFGQVYISWRREALARGDVARAGSAPAPREEPAAA